MTNYFNGENVSIRDLFEECEATVPTTFNYKNCRVGTSEKIFRGLNKILIRELGDEEDDHGSHGHKLFIGCPSNLSESTKTMDENSCIHSGPLGRISDKGLPLSCDLQMT